MGIPFCADYYKNSHRKRLCSISVWNTFAHTPLRQNSKGQMAVEYLPKSRYILRIQKLEGQMAVGSNQLYI